MPMPTEPITITEATGQFMSPDPSTTTRDDFTATFLMFKCAPDAHPVYKHLFKNHQALIRLLIHHPAMEQNLKQTFDTPANSKNKVYMVYVLIIEKWDFLLRTFQFLVAKVDPRNPMRSEMFMDVMGRAMMAKQLILDDSGKLEGMNASVGHKHDAGVNFGEEIKREAELLDQLPE